MLIGAHVHADRPLQQAAERDADVVQVFLSNPQSWAKPKPRSDAGEILASGFPIYVHAPYLINVASPNNRVRIPSRKILADTVAAAAVLGMRGVVVHGGHAGDGEEPGVAWERWRKALEPLDSPVPVLIENTAGGGNAVAREIERFSGLWEIIGDLNVGVCLDTCHAWAAGEELADLVDRVLSATGRIDLVHCNDSRDPFGSRRDRHANLGEGTIPGDLLVGVVATAGAPVIVETPDEEGGQAADIAWLRQRLDR